MSGSLDILAANYAPTPHCQYRGRPTPQRLPYKQAHQPPDRIRFARSPKANNATRVGITISTRPIRFVECFSPTNSTYNAYYYVKSAQCCGSAGSNKAEGTEKNSEQRVRRPCPRVREQWAIEMVASRTNTCVWESMECLCVCVRLSLFTLPMDGTIRCSVFPPGEGIFDLSEMIPPEEKFKYTRGTFFFRTSSERSARGFALRVGRPRAQGGPNRV